MIGHSMGGLVIKKAYISAHQDRDRPQLADRIRCVFFLATPHKGSEYASILNRVLKVSGITGLMSSREYVSELSKGSTSAQLINEDFGRHASSLRIYSFYETLEMNLGFTSALIVEKDSAILGPGFKNEIARYINANHRGICKFDSREDPNYILLKNSLVAAAQTLIRESSGAREEISRSQLRGLQVFLEIRGPPDDSYDKLEGSCEWIEVRDDFKEWLDPKVGIDPSQSHQYTPSVYWLIGNPGSGKTVLAAHIVSLLAARNLSCGFYHFHAGKHALQSLAGCLRSTAFQMATRSSTIRNALSNLTAEGATFDHDDARAVWLTIFTPVILQQAGIGTQYWVFDALDECIGYPELFTFLKGLRSAFPLKIFITSRKLPEFPKLIRQLENCAVHVVEIPIVDTMCDISLYVDDRVKALPIDTEKDRDYLAQEILTRSNASFLWVRLVLDELEGVYGYESMISVLHGIPEGMIPYYRRTIAEMKKNKREIHIIQAILTWTICASRLLTISELTEALHLDINVRLASSKAAIEGLCGQVVSVDKHTGIVQVVHTTAREFFLSDDAEEFTISKTKAHERLALMCLQLLVCPAMQPPKHRHQLNQVRRVKPSSPLLDYAITHFAEHILNSSTGNDTLLAPLSQFLDTTVLSWIDRAATRGDLHCLNRSAMALKVYLDRRDKPKTSLDRRADVVASWAIDLGRLGGKFSQPLTSQPQSIYFLIPPLCPVNTAIYTQFGRSPGGLSLTGSVHGDWDDCTATIFFPDDEAAAVAGNGDYVAVGTELGAIQLYSRGGNQLVRTIVGETGPIERLHLDPSGAFIVSASFQYITAWDLDGSKLWQERLRSRCILLTALSSVVICAMMSGKVIRRCITTGEQLEDRIYTYRALESPDQLLTGYAKAPFTGAISPDEELLALAYWKGPICVFELQTHEWIAWVVDSDSRIVAHLVFNPNPDVNLLLVAYDDSYLCLYEPWSGTPVRSRKPRTEESFHSLACSPDGRIFATVGAREYPKLWDFESLVLLYQIEIPLNYSSFRTLLFTQDGSSLIDLMAREMKIWTPAALTRKTISKDYEAGDQAAAVSTPARNHELDYPAKLRVVVSPEHGGTLIAGNNAGEVIAYDPDGNRTGVCGKSEAFIKETVLSKGDDIAWSDGNAIVHVWQLGVSQSPITHTARQRFQARFRDSISQLLFDHDGRYLLVSTRNSDHVYEVETGTLVGSLSFLSSERDVWRWVCLPASDDTAAARFALLCEGELVSYSVTSFPVRIQGAHVNLELKLEPGSLLTAINSLTIHPETSSLILDVSRSLGNWSDRLLFLFRIPGLFKPEQLVIDARPLCLLGPQHYMCFVGIDQAGGKLVYLNKASWVCSFGLAVPSHTHYTRHFFVPTELTVRANVVCPVLAKDKVVVFALHDKPAVIKNGLLFQETMPWNEN